MVILSWLRRSIRSLTSFFGERGVWIEEGERVTQEDLLRQYIKFMNSATKRYQLVTGDVDPDNFRSEEIIENFYRILKPADGRIDIIYQGPGQAVAKTMEPKILKGELEARTPELARLAATYPHKFFIYRATSVLNQHYAIVDDKSVLLQEPEHAPRGPKYIYMRYDDTRMVQEWGRRFDKLLSDTIRVEFDGNDRQ